MGEDKRSAKIPIGITAVILSAILVACHGDEGDNPIRPTGQRPVITSMGSNASELLAGQYTAVYCDAYDPDGDSLRYTWTADQGTFPESSHKAAVRWVAPSDPCTAILTCMVSDGHFNASMDLGIIVKPKP